MTARVFRVTADDAVGIVADRMHRAVAAILRDGVPILLVRGQMSDLVTEDRAQEFLQRFPAVEFVDVGGAGHMVAGTATMFSPTRWWRSSTATPPSRTGTGGP